MTSFALASVFVTVAALLSFANHRLWRLPSAIGMTVLSMGLATLLIVAGKVAGLGSTVHSGEIIAVVAGIDFNRLVLHGMLAFLLFAGALQMDTGKLRTQKLSVALLAVVSTIISTTLFALLAKAGLLLLGIDLPLGSALLLGALLSPTDPVAAIAILRGTGVSHEMEIRLSGEALFNDAVGAVLFIALLETAGGGTLPDAGVFFKLLLRQAGGGILLGLVLGALSAWIIRLTDMYRTEILLTLALAMGGYALADALDVSAPLEAVVSGLILGATLRTSVFSERAQDYVDKFWDVIDSIMNSLLFLLLGLELVVVPLHLPYLAAGLIAVPLVLLSRLVSVGAVMLPMLGLNQASGQALALMTWGGMRGALSVALALSLPASEERGLLLSMTYVVVVFAIVVQGLTIKHLAERFKRVPA